MTDLSKSPLAPRPLLLRLIPALLLIGVFALAFWLVTLWLQSQSSLAAYTGDRNAREVVIGNDVVSVAANHIRFAASHHKGTAEQLELVFLWPGGEGYQDTLKAAFENTGPNRKLIFLTLEKRQMDMDMTGRFRPIYRDLLTGTPKGGPAGLFYQALKAGSGYDGEALVVDNPDTPSYVARCETREGDAAASCIRDLLVGKELSVTYRFPLQLLGEWKAIDGVVRRWADSMVQR